MTEPKCPICDEPMEHYSHVEEGHLTIEEGETCLRLHYSYTYAHGFTTIMVGNRTWGWSYLDPMEQISLHLREIDNAIGQQRSVA